MTTAIKSKVSKQAIELINSLGGPPLGITESLDHLKVSLENHSASQATVWSLNVLDQTLKRQGFELKKNIGKTNPYIH